MFEEANINDLNAFKFGHAQNTEQGTGCSVFIAPQGAVCGVDVSGAAPATRETDLLRPDNMIETVHAVVLSGGSAFGLEASSGVMEALAERSIGFSLLGNIIPIVSAASLFDLLLGGNGYPDKKMGARAVEHAFSSSEFAQGNVGAGTGASAGKVLGPGQAMKTGFGSCIFKLDELVVGAFVAVNAVGNIRNPEGGWLAGCRDAKGKIVDAKLSFIQIAKDLPGKTSAAATMNTTLGVVVTNAKLTKAQASKVSQITNDAYARAINPVHTSNDGDAIFTLASGEKEVLPDMVGIIACEAMEEAIYRAARFADSAYGLPSAKDMA